MVLILNLIVFMCCFGYAFVLACYQRRITTIIITIMYNRIMYVYVYVNITIEKLSVRILVDLQICFEKRSGSFCLCKYVFTAFNWVCLCVIWKRVERMNTF